jgi:hypothetical protein
VRLTETTSAASTPQIVFMFALSNCMLSLNQLKYVFQLHTSATGLGEGGHSEGFYSANAASRLKTSGPPALTNYLLLSPYHRWAISPLPRTQRVGDLPEPASFGQSP